MKKKFSLFSIILLLIFGCNATRVAIPDGSIADVSRVNESSADSHYAVLKWFTTAFNDPKKKATETAAAKKGMAAAENIIYAKWAKSTADQFSTINYTNGKLRFTPDHTAKAKDIKAAIDAVNAKVALKPSLTQATSFSWIKQLAKNKSFPGWLSSTKLHLDFSSRHPNLRSNLSAFLNQKHSGIKAKIAELMKAQNYEECFKVLENAKVAFAGTSHEAKFHSQLQSLSPMLIKQQINKIKAIGYKTQKSNFSVKSGLYEARSKWKTNDYLKAAFQSTDIQTVFGDLQKDIGQEQGNIWHQEMQKLVSKKHYWHLYLKQKELLKMAAEFEDGVETGSLKVIWEKYNSYLPETYEHFLMKAFDEIKKGERHGSAMILTSMIRDINAFLTEQKQRSKGDATDKILNSADFKQLETDSKKEIKQLVSRKLFIGEIKGGDGLQLILRAEFKKVFANSKVLYGMSVENNDIKPRAHDYVLKGGTFKVDANRLGNILKETKEVVLKGDINSEPNLVWVNATKRQRKEENIEPFIFKQEYIPFTVTKNTHTINSTGSFISNLEHKGNEIFFKIDKQLKKTYITEESKKGKSTWKDTKAKKEVKLDKVPTPKLQIDQPIGILQMKSYTEKEIQKSMILSFAHKFGQYPLNLKKEAETFLSNNKYEVAANSYGICLEYMNNLDLKAKSSLFNPEKVEAHNKEEYAKNKKLLADLATLKKSIWQESVNCLIKFLEK